VKEPIVRQHSPCGASSNIPDTIVIHCMAEYVKDIEGNYTFAPRYLENAGLSAHSLIAPDGTNYRCREDNEGAYHALGHNTNTLGMEILVAGKHDYASFAKTIKTDYVTNPQWEAAVKQCREWIEKFGITKIVRHSDISPDRKIDPGAGFKWKKFLDVVKRSEVK